jgi:hypothetical protein
VLIVLIWWFHVLIFAGLCCRFASNAFAASCCGSWHASLARGLTLLQDSLMKPDRASQAA